MRFSITSSALLCFLASSSVLASPQFSRDDTKVKRDGNLSTVGDAFQNVTDAIGNGITNYTTAVGNATRNAINNDDDNAAPSSVNIPSHQIYLALGGSILAGSLLI